MLDNTPLQPFYLSFYLTDSHVCCDPPLYLICQQTLLHAWKHHCLTQQPFYFVILPHSFRWPLCPSPPLYLICWQILFPAWKHHCLIQQPFPLVILPHRFRLPLCPTIADRFSPCLTTPLLPSCLPCYHVIYHTDSEDRFYTHDYIQHTGIHKFCSTFSAQTFYNHNFSIDSDDHDSIGKFTSTPYREVAPSAQPHHFTSCSTILSHIRMHGYLTSHWFCCMFLPQIIYTWYIYIYTQQHRIYLVFLYLGFKTVCGTNKQYVV